MYTRPMKRLTIGTRACTEILGLLIHLAWADGKLAEEEVHGIRAALEVLNLSREQRARIEDAMKAPLPLDQILVDTLSPRDQAFAFVAAVWLTGVDQDVDPKEQRVLAELATRLGFDGEREQELRALAHDLEPPVGGDTSWAKRLVTLFKAIPTRLEASTLDAIDIAFEHE